MVKLATFIALNVIPDDEGDDEVDDTRELQIEEALKLYQNAIKLHARGPAYFDEAFEAYATLFNSEVFSYDDQDASTAQEPQTDQDVDSDDTEVGAVGRELVSSAANLRTGTDAAPNTLPQILHLAYKNRGQFLLDRLGQFLSQATHTGRDGQHRTRVVLDRVLQLYTEALKTDETDSELWRRTARIADALGKKRIARLCLESALAHDQDGNAGAQSSLHMGLEDALAQEQLRQLLERIGDSRSMANGPMSKLKHKRLSPAWQLGLDPYPFLPHSPSDSDDRAEVQQMLRSMVPQHRIECEAPSWFEVGKALLTAQKAQQQGQLETTPGAAVQFYFPGNEELGDDDDADEHQDARGNLPGRLEGSGAESNTETPKTAPLTTESAVDASPANLTVAQTSGAAGAEDNARIPLRKRTTSAAGLAESADGGRIRSKRIRARESQAEAAASTEKTTVDTARQSDSLIAVRTAADERLFKVAGELIDDLGISCLGSAASLHEIGTEVAASPMEGQKVPANIDSDDIPFADLYLSFSSWDQNKHDAFASQQDSHELEPKAKSKGSKPDQRFDLTRVLDYTKRGLDKENVEHRPVKEGLAKFVKQVKLERMQIIEASFLWLDCLISPQQNETRPLDGSQTYRRSSYLCDSWSDPLKDLVLQMLVCLDKHMYQVLRSDSEKLESWFQKIRLSAVEAAPPRSLLTVMDTTQTVFELHLDTYVLMTAADSGTDYVATSTQRDRVERWAAIMDRLAQIYFHLEPKPATEDDLSFRYLWATQILVSLPMEASTERMVEGMGELKRYLTVAGSPSFELPNSASMPQISIAAAESEMSKSASLDYFSELFSSSPADPVFLIEKLEPILEPQEVALVTGESVLSFSPGPQDHSTTGNVEDNLSEKVLAQGNSLPRLRAAVTFLSQANPSLRLFLWAKLSQAYKDIEYPTKVLSSHLRCIEIITAEITKGSGGNMSQATRQTSTLKWLHDINEHLSKAIVIAVNGVSAFECIDYEHIKDSVAAVSRLARWLHAGALFEDSVRSGRVSPVVASPRLSSASVTAATDKLREMQIRAWILLYTLLKEGILQNRGLSSAWSDRLMQYLFAVHGVTGSRAFCGASNKILPKYIISELCKLDLAGESQDEMLQALYDVYGIKLGTFSAKVQEHNCPSEPLDRSIAVDTLTFILPLLRSVNIKDLSKPEYKNTIDTFQASISTLKPPKLLATNSRILKAFVDSSINPSDLYRVMRGLFHLTGINIPSQHTTVARTGWYFFLGDTALTRFRCQKRTTASPKEDLMAAAKFLKLDLQHDMDKWLTWYRLAQTKDSLIEEDVLWSADNINGTREELKTLQRHAIHCYMVAVALADRSDETSPEVAERISYLYTDFGIRLYASSRAPFDMEAFSLDDYRRMFNGDQVYESTPHTQMSEYAVWKLATTLFSRATKGRPDYWINHYMRGKALWKMYNDASNETEPPGVAIRREHVVGCLIRAIEHLPERKSEKHDPIFEPHYKLVSVVHKMVQKSDLNVSEASNVLEVTPFVKKVQPAYDQDSWEPFVLRLLNVLRTADKANWHHRMTARAAHVIYDGSEADLPAAVGARHELTQQIFTKTMSVQVWKPEFERAGRHFVYTSRYTLFFVRLLLQLNDKTSMEALAKRVRKRAADFYQHTKVWTEVGRAYMKLLRREGSVPEGETETQLKHVTTDELSARWPRICSWLKDVAASEPIVDVMSQAHELKRLNGSLTPAGPFDDLLTDSFARMYRSALTDSADDAEEEPDRPRGSNGRDTMSVENLVMNTDGAVDQPSISGPNQGAPVLQQATKQRTKALTKKEILRKIELIINRPSAHGAAFTAPAGGGRSGRVDDGTKAASTAAAVAAISPVPAPRSRRGSGAAASPERDAIRGLSPSQPNSPSSTSSAPDDEGGSGDAGSDDDADDEAPRERSPAVDEDDDEDGEGDAGGRSSRAESLDANDNDNEGSVHESTHSSRDRPAEVYDASADATMRDAVDENDNDDDDGDDEDKVTRERGDIEE